MANPRLFLPCCAALLLLVGEPPGQVKGPILSKFDMIPKGLTIKEEFHPVSDL